MEEKLYAVFGSGLEIEMTREQANSVSHSGDCEADVDALLADPEIAARLDKIGHDAMARELREYGAWTDEELKDKTMTRKRFIWCAGCNLSEELFAEEAR